MASMGQKGLKMRGRSDMRIEMYWRPLGKLANYLIMIIITISCIRKKRYITSHGGNKQQIPHLRMPVESYDNLFGW